ncbi:MAG: hydroxymethylbilane synthase [Acidobacteria bacterium]|nr:MAG: hydroxymethylbilane synthase [Acidobacteriota bacterium]
MKLRLGTRGSRLAMIQARWVARRLERDGHEPEIVVIRTSGDRVQDRAFAQVGTQGVFSAEIENALVERRIDVAVHSYKDLPSKSPDGLVVAAVPERVDPADRLLARPDALDEGGALRRGARLGTASARRTALWRALRPDVEIGLLRGNLPTRVARALDGTFDAVVLAAAGLDRIDRAAQDDPELALDRSGLVERRLDPEVFVPAPSQGALALQVRADDAGVREAIEAIDDREAHRAVRAERELLARVEGGCQVPFGAWCVAATDGTFTLRAVLERGGRLRRARADGDDPLALVDAVWRELTAGGEATDGR